jgi:hypothetical protein
VLTRRLYLLQHLRFLLSLSSSAFHFQVHPEIGLVKATNLCLVSSKCTSPQALRASHAGQYFPLQALVHVLTRIAR